VGRAVYNPGSEISLRIFTREDEALDEAWLRNHIERAQTHRDALRVDADVYRLLHAEADSIPGLVADRYGDYFVLQVGSGAVERRLAPIVAVLEGLFAPAGVLLRGDTPVRRREGLARRVETLSGEIPESVIVRGGPVRYSVRPWAGQKTRGFLDHPEILTIPEPRYFKCAVMECL
jgi:23S rRNA (cytosine1962-C5)-methyltransferase